MKIDLGSKYEEMTPSSLSVNSKRKSYPCLHIDCGDELLEGLPSEGIMEIRFKVTSRSTNERDSKKTCCVTIEAREILEVEPIEKSEDDEEDESESPESALDKLASLSTAKG